MKLFEAQQLAEELIKHYRIDDFKFEFDTATERFGVCSTKNKTIRLSTSLTELNDQATVKLTILHEIAHALTPYQGHNEVWQRVCKAIGGDGQRCYDDQVETPPAKWTAHCPHCNGNWPKQRKNKYLYCGECYKNNNNRAKKEFKLKWIINQRG